MGILIGVCVGLAWIIFNKVYFKAATQASDEAFRTMEQMDQRYATLQAAEIKQRKLSESAQLFVPWEFLKILGLNDLSAARLGQSVEQKLSILFLDLRGFTKICETLSPRETFVFLNDFYGLLAPHIREHRGFIDKYSGDGIMAVFAKGPHDAVEAAMDILKTIEERNKSQKSEDRKLRISIGVATGKALLGTLGHESQLAVSVVSNVVNIASKLEHYNRELKTCFLVDADTAKAAESLGISHKSRGLAHLGGQTGNVEVFEILQEEEKYRIASALSEINEANKRITEDSTDDDEPSIKVLLDTKK